MQLRYSLYKRAEYDQGKFPCWKQRQTTAKQQTASLIIGTSEGSQCLSTGTKWLYGHTLKSQ